MVVAVKDGRSPLVLDPAPAPPAPTSAAGPSSSTPANTASASSASAAGLQSNGGKEKELSALDPWDRKKLEAREEWERWAEFEHGGTPGDAEPPTYNSHSGAFAGEEGGGRGGGGGEGDVYGRRM